jgi:hypothetical protein
MSSAVNGGCQCGAVRYQSSAAPGFSLHCHCRQCQRITGAGHASQFGLPANAVIITGEFRVYKLTADSGNTVESAFCGVCGSPLFKRTSGHPALLFFHAATLDDPSPFKAQRSVWTASRQPWDPVDPSAPAG